MHKDLALWQFIAKQLKSKEPVMLLIVTESSGSSPGRQGFKMAVSTRGKMRGSIGGGIMEVKLVELAKDRLHKKDNTPVVKKQIHSAAATHHRSGMICSGEQTVVLCYLDTWFGKPVKRIVRSLTNYTPAIMRISLLSDSLKFEVISGLQHGSLSRFLKLTTDSFRYEENLGMHNRLYIIGGGHCALALSATMARMDFFITLLEDRPSLSTVLENNYVHEKHILASYEEVGIRVPEGENSYVVIMTLGYRTDEIVLRQLMHKKFKYLGLLGSEAKIKTMMNKFVKEKISRTVLKRIHAPIGLAIHSHTPEEIAISIAAEIIRIKNEHF